MCKALVWRHDKFEAIKVVIRSRKSKDRQYRRQMKNEQKDKQWSAKHYAENYRLSNTNPSKTGGEGNPVLRNGK